MEASCHARARLSAMMRPMTTSDIQGTAGYGANAQALASQYESITFAEVHRDVMHLFPPAPSRVLDVGAGSGRDSAALARLGHHVTAVEPTAELRAEGERLHADSGIEWRDDHLPALAQTRAGGDRYDLILLTAVWMHLDAEERSTAMRALALLLADGGRIIMSLRHGPVPEGRRMFDVSAEETIALAAAHGLRVCHHSEREDMLDRRDVRWSFLGFQSRQ
jgi:protein-L-isoaspartate O-methyltransferase